MINCLDVQYLKSLSILGTNWAHILIFKVKWGSCSVSCPRVQFLDGGTKKLLPFAIRWDNWVELLPF